MGCFRGDGLRLGYVRVGGPCQAPNMLLVGGFENKDQVGIEAINGDIK